jgi:DNA polymerase-4
MCPLTVKEYWGYTITCKKHYSYSWTDRYVCQNRTLEVEQMGDRVILHSDINCCYASIEHLHHPELAGKPLAVGGDPEARHGLVLTADYIAKKYGVKTGMALWQAKQVCPDITFVSPRMDLYLRFSRMAHEIYAEYTDRQEPYGIDECWLDVTGSSSLKGDGLLIAQEISRRMKSELGITVSVGVSFKDICKAWFSVRRHTEGGAKRTLISAFMPLRL